MEKTGTTPANEHLRAPGAVEIQTANVERQSSSLNVTYSAAISLPPEDQAMTDVH